MTGERDQLGLDNILGFFFFESINNFQTPPPRFGQTECVSGWSGTRCIFYQRSVQRVPNIIRHNEDIVVEVRRGKKETKFIRLDITNGGCITRAITRKGGGPIIIISSVFLPQLKYNITTEMFLWGCDCRFRARSSGNLNGAISTTLASFPYLSLSSPIQ